MKAVSLMNNNIGQKSLVFCLCRKIVRHVHFTFHDTSTFFTNTEKKASIENIFIVEEEQIVFCARVMKHLYSRKMLKEIFNLSDLL